MIFNLPVIFKDFKIFEKILYPQKFCVLYPKCFCIIIYNQETSQFGTQKKCIVYVYHTISGYKGRISFDKESTYYLLEKAFLERHFSAWLYNFKIIVLCRSFLYMNLKF